uniref:Zinc finger AN1-type containing 2A n=1 Tax=Panthera tigris altaica TaxID=74533 RepID=A0A8C9KW02_PANTA
FLPLQCDACKQDFHKDHFTCAAHKCPYTFEKVIDLPVKKGEIPDVVVGDCHPRKKEKIFICRRSKEGCKKEMLQVICDQCHGSFRIQRRHPLDHSCPRGNLAVSRLSWDVLAHVHGPGTLTVGIGYWSER